MISCSIFSIWWSSLGFGWNQAFNGHDEALEVEKLGQTKSKMYRTQTQDQQVGTLLRHLGHEKYGRKERCVSENNSEHDFVTVCLAYFCFKFLPAHFPPCHQIVRHVSPVVPFYPLVGGFP